MQKLIVAILFLGLLITGVLGTETRMLFFWPGCLLLGIAGLMATARWRLRVSFPPSDMCLLTVVAFALYIVVRACLSSVGYYAREDVFIVCAALVTYLLTATAASHPGARMGLVYVLLALTVGNLAVGLIHFSGRWDFHVVPGFFRAFEAGRIGGFYNNPNHLAAFLSMVMFLCAGWMLFGRVGPALRLVLGFVILTVATGTALTVSRGALIGVAAGASFFGIVALWLVWKTQRHLFKWMLIAGVVLLGLATAVLMKVNEDALRRRMAGEHAVSDIREHIWSSALTQHAESPLVGVGARMFYSGSVQYRDAALAGWTGDALFAHNEYLQMLADYGWVGLGLLALLVMAHVRNGLRFVGWFARVKFWRTGELADVTLALAVGSLAAVVATAVHAVVEFQWHIPAVAVTGAVLLGMLANPGFDSDAPRVRVPGVRVGMKLLGAAAALALLLGAVFWGTADYHVGKAAVLAKQKDQAGALEHLLRAGDIDPMNGSILYQRGLLELDSWRPDKSEAERKRIIQAALEDLQRSCELNGFSHLTYLALADTLDAAGRHDDALKAIQQALRLAPLHEEPRLTLGKHFHNLRQFEKAEAAYLWAANANAKNGEGVMNWRSLYVQMLKDTAFLASRTRGQK